MDLYDHIENTRFVGEEFMTWLWFRADVNEGLFTLPNGDAVELQFDNQMTLEAHLAQAERSRLTGGAPGYSPEAREALRTGKKVTQAKLRLNVDGREWVTTMSAQTLALGSMRIPAVLSREEDDKFYERMHLLEEADLTLRSLFLGFLQLRLDPDRWDAELAALKKWALTPVS